MSNKYDNEIKLLEASQIEEDDNVANNLILKAINMITQNLSELKLSSAYECYVLGYAWYLLRSQDSDRHENIEKYLKLSIEKDPECAWSKLYLGHYYFDENQYEKSLSLFSKIDGSVFVKIDQVWRFLKLQELIICCRIYVNSNEIYFDEFINNYIETDEVDRPVMCELKQCIDSRALEKFKKEDKIKLVNFIEKYY